MINHKGYSYILEMLHQEQLDEAYYRLWYIINHNPNSDYMYEQLVKVSKLWYYQQRFNCHYQPDLEHLISLFNSVH
jgi:hypothetical protein